MWRETLAAMGGTPTPLEWAEVYTALGQGVVDAAEAPLSTLVDGRLYEAAGHVTLTGHFNAVSGFVMSERRFQALPAPLRPVLEEELVRAGDEASRATIARQQGYEAALRARGVAVHAPDGAAFRRATRVVYDRFPRWSPGLRARVLAELGA
jgi:TRAP-type C4-dicarboxylate transport system substrate-binding protein